MDKKYVQNVSVPKKKITKIVEMTYLNALQAEDQVISNKLLAYKERIQSSRIPPALTFNTGGIICKHWYLLQLNGNHTDIFMEHPIFAFRRKKNVKDLIGQNKTINLGDSKDIKKTKQNVHTVYLKKITCAAKSSVTN